jgi:hypothetical protein
MSRFYYSDVQSLTGKPGLLPFLEVTLYYADDSRHIKELTVPAVVDSGSTVNVLPCDIGERFGLNWQEQRDILRPGGVVFGRPSLALPLWGKVPGFKPVQMPFAWSELPSTQLRVLLGQVNFFDEFFVDFRKPLGYFEVVLKDE